jgi:hypothetical protein
MQTILRSLQPMLRAGAVTMAWLVGVTLAFWLKTGDLDLVTPGINMVFAVAITCFWLSDMLDGGHVAA